MYIYITVLLLQYCSEPTVILEGPKDMQLMPYVDVMFPCVARTDASTPLTRSWYYDNKPIANDHVSSYIYRPIVLFIREYNHLG